MGAALTGLPGAQLRIEVVTRQTQQARDSRRHAGHGLAVALHAGRQLARGIAFEHELASMA